MTEAITRPVQYTGVIPLHQGIYVYRCWTADEACVYVGRSKHVLRRIGAHALIGWWKTVHHVDVAMFASDTEAEAEEIIQIRHWQPVNNNQHNRNWARKKSVRPRTHCPRNHEYTPENTLYNSLGSKVCRECKNAKARAKPKKGRPRGEQAKASRLTAAMVADIRRRRALGATISELSREYGVTRTTIRTVANGLSWRHVPPE